ncbi:uncharacterized protein LOC141910034 [Tubulanus polymorphus]|uniref:uncharacterized protein LOC141906011 n=1 Tax=Tubulanus polymorphus TaxID=672921 RepID=UPI003DA29529
MPRDYVKKVGGRPYNCYDAGDMQAAIQACEDGLSKKKAAELFHVSRTSLRRHLEAYRRGEEIKKPGGQTVLTAEEEELVVHSLQILSDWGFGLDRNDIRLIVRDFIRGLGRKNQFKGDLPGLDWMRLFEERHKSKISRRIAQNFPLNRAEACSQKIVDDFFMKLEKLLDENQLLHSPGHIFNMDETGFQTDIGSKKVLCRRGDKNPHVTVGSSTKTMYTVVECCSADGNFLAPYVVYKAKNLYESWCTGGPERARYNVSDSGWMETPQFSEWFKKVFLEETKTIPGKKLLLYDGHNSHINLDVLNLAMQNDVIIFCIPAHTSSILQPLDVGVYKALKQSWRKVLNEHYVSTRFKSVDKATFPSLLNKVHQSSCMSRMNAINAFEKCGIYPLDKTKIGDELLKTSCALPETPTETVTNDNEITRTDASRSRENISVQPRDLLRSSTQFREGPSTITVTAEVHSKPPGSNVITPRPERSQNSDVLSPKSSLEKALLDHFKYSAPEPPKKRKRLDRKFAECLTVNDVVERLEQEEQKKEQKRAKKKKPNSKIRKKVNGNKENVSDSEDGNEEEPEIDDDSDDDIGQLENDSDMIGQMENMIAREYEIGKFVIAVYNQKWYVTTVLKSSPAISPTVFLKYKRWHGVNRFSSPPKDDILETCKEDILCSISESDIINVGSRFVGVTSEKLALIEKCFSKWCDEYGE